MAKFAVKLLFVLSFVGFKVGSEQLWKVKFSSTNDTDENVIIPFKLGAFDNVRVKDFMAS